MAWIGVDWIKIGVRLEYEWSRVEYWSSAFSPLDWLHFMLIITIGTANSVNVSIVREKYQLTVPDVRLSTILMIVNFSF